MNEKKIDYLGPRFIMAIITSLISDASLLITILFLVIPLVGLMTIPFLIMALLFHYFFAGTILLFAIYPKLKHLMPKIALILAILIPFPSLTVGVVLAIILQNRIIEFVITQAAIAVATGGVGNVVSAGAVVAKAGATAAKGAETASAVRTGTLGAKAVTVKKEASLGAESAELETTGAKKTGTSAAEKGKTPEQQKDVFKDKMAARKEKLNKIMDKIHEQEEQDEEDD